MIPVHPVVSIGCKLLLLNVCTVSPHLGIRLPNTDRVAITGSDNIVPHTLEKKKNTKLYCSPQQSNHKKSVRNVLPDAPVG